MPPDIEMNILNGKEDSLTQGSTWSTREPSRGSRGQRHSATAPFGRWVEGFRRDPNRRFTPKGAIHQLGEGAMGGMDDMDELSNVATRERRGAHYFDLHAANVGTANTNLARELKGRHLQMIAIGGSIGGSPPGLLHLVSRLSRGNSNIPPASSRWDRGSGSYVAYRHHAPICWIKITSSLFLYANPAST